MFEAERHKVVLDEGFKTQQRSNLLGVATGKYDCGVVARVCPVVLEFGDHTADSAGTQGRGGVAPT